MSVELIILAGFLGSGKTSLLVDLLQSDKKGETGVIVNEAGEIGIDGVVVEDGSLDASVTMLANGCVCCSLRSGLVDTVSTLLDAPRPPGYAPITRIVLETSGLSRPGPIIASLTDPELSSRGIRVSVLTVYDCDRGLLNVEAFDEAAAQLAAAQRVVFSKVDLVDQTSLAHHVSIVRGMNPLAQIVVETDRKRSVDLAFSPSTQKDSVDLAIKGLISSGRSFAHPRINVMKGVIRHDISWDSVSIWLDDLAALCGERLLRVKAVLNVSDCSEPVLVQSVGTTFGMPRRMMQHREVGDICVVITRDIDAMEINAAFPDPPVMLSVLNAEPDGERLHFKQEIAVTTQ